MTIQNTTTNDFAACILLATDGGTLTMNDVTLLCATDGIYVTPPGSNPINITASNLTALGTWDWLHADNESGDGVVTANFTRLTVSMDGSSGLQGAGDSTGISYGGVAYVLNVTNATLAAANGPFLTVTCDLSGVVANFSNTTFTATGAVPPILEIKADGAGTTVNLHLCTYDPAKTLATGGATINVV